MHFSLNFDGAINFHRSSPESDVELQIDNSLQAG